VAVALTIKVLAWPKIEYFENVLEILFLGIGLNSRYEFSLAGWRGIYPGLKLSNFV